MLHRLSRAAALVAVAALATACVSPSGDTPDQMRASARAMHDETLAQAKAKHADLGGALAGAPGYVVFDTWVSKILIVGWANGYGVLVDNRDGSQTVIDNFTVAVGPGIELARVGGVLVLHDNESVDGVKAGVTEFGGDAEAAFQFGDFGGAARGMATGPSSTQYPVFNGGVALHASIFWAFLSPDEDTAK
jgi:hypothetical protein